MYIPTECETLNFGSCVRLYKIVSTLQS